MTRHVDDINALGGQTGMALPVCLHFTKQKSIYLLIPFEDIKHNRLFDEN